MAGGGKEQAIQNIASCLVAAGSSLEKITRRRIYMIDIKQVQDVDKIWAQWVSEPWPVSTCVGVTALAKEGALVELEVSRTTAKAREETEGGEEGECRCRHSRRVPCSDAW